MTMGPSFIMLPPPLFLAALCFWKDAARAAEISQDGQGTRRVKCVSAKEEHIGKTCIRRYVDTQGNKKGARARERGGGERDRGRARETVLWLSTCGRFGSRCLEKREKVSTRRRVAEKAF